jgi:hypothetical protein
MVQKEVTKKTGTYGLIGLLLAIMLVAMIYSYGGAPQITPNNPLPQVSPTSGPSTESQVAPLTTFTSYEQLRDFLNSTSPTATGTTQLPRTSTVTHLPQRQLQRHKLLAPKTTPPPTFRWPV